MTAHQDEAAASGQDGITRQVFRSPVAIVVWWIWVLFAVANLIDLAVQGHDHISLVAAIILILVTGVMYAAVQRPRVIADEQDLRIVNPLRDHRIGWGAVATAEAADLVRVRCEWQGGRKAFYVWAIYASRRRRYVAEMREQRTRSRRTPAPRGYGTVPQASGTEKVSAEPNDAERVVAAITSRADSSRMAATQPEAGPPVSTWHWPAVVAIIIPALALVIAIMA